MLSIGQIIAACKGHLPPGWAGDLGKLFPPGYSGSISLLQYYVIFIYRVLATQGYAENSQGQSFLAPSCYSNFWLGVDGLGNWFFAWIYGDSDRRTDPRQGGFVFKFNPPDGHGRGFIDTSRPPMLTLSCAAGQDDLIRLNWPKMLSGGGSLSFQAPPGDMSTSAAFIAEGFTTTPIFLSAKKVAPANGVPSGSSLFPFPSNIPANALHPQGASLLGAPQQPDGGAGGGQSFSTLDAFEDWTPEIGGI